MVSSDAKVWLFLVFCGVLIIHGVESSWNIVNGKEMYIPSGSELKQSNIDEVNKIWNRDDGKSMFSPTNSQQRPAINYESVPNWNHDNGKQIYIPPNTNVRPQYPDHINWEPSRDGEVIFNPDEML